MTEDQLDRLIDLAFDFVCERPLSDFVQTEDIVKALDQVAQPSRVQRLVERLVAPSRQRLLALAGASQLKLAVWLPEATQQILADFLGQPLHLPKDEVERAVGSEKVREAVRKMLEEAFQTFVDKAFAAAPLSSKGGGVGKLLGLGVKTATAAGKGVFDALTGGLSDELRRQLASRLRDFVELGVELVQRRLVERLTSEETSRQLGQGRKKIFLQTLERTETEAAKQIGRQPHAMIDALVPVLVQHNWQRQEARAAIVAEVEAALVELSKQSTGELLTELGLRDQARELLKQRARPMIQKFVADPRFGAWLASAFAPKLTP